MTANTGKTNPAKDKRGKLTGLANEGLNAENSISMAAIRAMSQIININNLPKFLIFNGCLH